MPITSEPAPNPPPVGTARIRITGIRGDSNWGVGWWAQVGGVPVEADLLALAEDVYGAFKASVLANCSTEVHMNECKVTYYDGLGNPAAAVFHDDIGSDTHQDLPSNAAALLSWQISATYRGGKPRTYLPAGTTGQQASARTWADGFVSSLGANAATFLSTVDAITTTNITLVTLGTVAFFRAGVALAPPRFEAFSGVGVQKRICTQRRRLGAEIL
jgi:hypothetical protein